MSKARYMLAMRLILAFFMIFLLAGCAPRYVTDYDLYPPESARGKQCAAQCETAKERCEKECYRQALNRCEGRAYNRYDSWGWYGSGGGWGTGIGTAFPSGTRASCHPDSCLQACRATYLACHENCGGKVVPREPRCVAGCPAKSH